MFVDEKAAGEKTPLKVGTLKPSEAIRRGHSMIEEDDGKFLSAGRGCALGAMWVGMGRSEGEWAKLFDPKGPIDGWRLMSSELGIPLDLSRRINNLHCSGRPRLAIAAMLESEGN